MSVLLLLLLLLFSSPLFLSGRRCCHIREGKGACFAGQKARVIAHHHRSETPFRPRGAAADVDRGVMILRDRLTAAAHTCVSARACRGWRLSLALSRPRSVTRASADETASSRRPAVPRDERKVREKKKTNRKRTPLYRRRRGSITVRTGRRGHTVPRFSRARATSSTAAVVVVVGR